VQHSWRQHTTARQYICSEHALHLCRVFLYLHQTVGAHLFVFISRYSLLNRPLQLPLVLHAQVTLPCCAKHHARRKSGRRAIASTLHPSFVGLCIDKANLKKLTAICSKLTSDLLYAGVRTLNPMSTCTATPGAPRSSATEAETVPVRTSVPWPLLGIPLVHCQGQQPLVHAARTQPEALQGHGVSATAVSVEFWMH